MISSWLDNRGGRDAKRHENSQISLSDDELDLKEQQEYKQIERKNEEIFANMLRERGTLAGEYVYPKKLRLPPKSGRDKNTIYSDLWETDPTPVEVKTADVIHRVQEATGQAAWQCKRARRYFKNNEIKSSIYLFTSDVESGSENFRELCEDHINERDFKEIILAEQVELNDTETKMPTILAQWVNPTLEWHTWVQCMTNIPYSRGSSSGPARGG